MIVTRAGKVVNNKQQDFDHTRREFLKMFLTGAAGIATAYALGTLTPIAHARHVPFVSPEYVIESEDVRKVKESSRPYVLIEQRKGEAIAVSEDGEVILRNTDHRKVIQEVFDKYENQAKTTGVWVILFPRDGPFIIKSGQTGIHIPCENGGRWHIYGCGGKSQYTIRDIYFKGDGNIFENEGAAESWTGITLEGLAIELKGPKSNGLKIYSLMAARDLYIVGNYPGEPQVKTYGIAFRNGNTHLIENCWVMNTHAGFVQIHGEHGILLSCHVAGASWTEYPYLIPGYHYATFADMGYPIENGSRHHVLVLCHAYYGGDPSKGATFCVNASILIFAKCEGHKSRTCFKCDGRGSVCIYPYVTGWEGQWLFQPPEAWEIIDPYDITIAADDTYHMVKGGYRVTLEKLILGKGSADPWYWNTFTKPLKSLILSFWNWFWDGSTVHGREIGIYSAMYNVDVYSLVVENLTTGRKLLEIDKSGFFRANIPVPIDSGMVSVPAGGETVIAQFTVPTGFRLLIHSIMELYDPAGTISAEVYNATDDVTVTGTVDGFSNLGWEVDEGKIVVFKLKNSDTANERTGRYSFTISLIPK